MSVSSGRRGDGSLERLTMRSTKRESYERPRIKTVPASQIIELMGPVSCGSGGVDPLPSSGGFDISGQSGSGAKSFN